MRVHRPAHHVVCIAPDFAQQLEPARHPAASLHQREQQLILLGPQLGRPSRSADLMAGEIDRDVPEAVQRGIGRSFTPRPVEKILRAPDRSNHALVVERFEQIVERLNLECANRVLFEGRNEDDGGRTLAARCSRDRKAVEIGHLNVEEDEIRRAATQQFDRVAAIRALVDPHDAADLLQYAFEPPARRRLVVNDDRAHGHYTECRSLPAHRSRWAAAHSSARTDGSARTAP